MPPLFKFTMRVQQFSHIFRLHFILVLSLFPPHLQWLPPLKSFFFFFFSLELLQSPIRVGIHSFQTPISIDILTSFNELQMFLIASRMVNIFRGFQSINTLPRPTKGVTPYGTYSLTKYISWTIGLDWRSYFLIHRLQKGCCVIRHEKTTLAISLMSLSENPWVTSCTVNEQ